MAILKPDEKCAYCQANIFHRGKNHKLKMHVGVVTFGIGVKHEDCDEHAKQENKRLMRERRKNRIIDDATDSEVA